VSQPHRRPRHRSVSRTIRLRRTVLGVVVLALVAVATVRLVSREDATEAAAAAADRLPGVQATPSAPPPAAPESTPSQTPPQDSQDGSTTTEAPRRTEVAVPQNGTGRIAVVSVPGPQSTA
jgi:hypothetical protein